ncbi:MAG: SGNH/GDSL hydrolase family protein [bacterium]
MTRHRAVFFLSYVWALLILATAMAGNCTELTSGTSPVATSELIVRSVAYPGDTARLDRVMEKALRGEPLTLGVVGGSITEGGVASSVDKRWANRVAAWWTATFPKSKLTFVNAGLGATGSNIGAHRVQRDLLCHKPDFVVIEFAVNDNCTSGAMETMEGLVRQILALPNQPAALMLCTMHQDGMNTQPFHDLIGRYYGLPIISYRDALWPEIQAGRIKWSDIAGDHVHPNDLGHQYLAEFVTGYLKQTLAHLFEAKNLPAIKPLPKPLISDIYARTAWWDGANLKPARNQGWQVSDPTPPPKTFGKCWVADKPGSTMELEVEGAALTMLYYSEKADLGMAEVRVDGGAPEKLDAWFPMSWGGYTAFRSIGHDLTPGRHQIQITLLKEKAPASKGHRFEIRAILAAGLKDIR